MNERYADALRPLARLTRGALIVLALGALALTYLRFTTPDVVLFNATGSMPIGLYVRIDVAPTRGAIVTVRARDVAPAYAASRRFDDADDRFIKRVAAVGGDHICVRDRSVLINYMAIGERRATDSAGRRLPAWTGCRVLDTDEVFLLGETAQSFDARYWGPVRLALIEGVWRRL